MDCIICENNTGAKATLPCCWSNICNDCLAQHVKIQLSQGQYIIKCPSFQCKKNVPLASYSSIIDDGTLEKQRLLEINNKKDPTIKTCPFCNHITKVSKAKVLSMRWSEKKVDSSFKSCRIVCAICSNPWCFHCHKPWHMNKSCIEESGVYDKMLFKNWMKATNQNQNQRNAYPCPHCGLYIERMSGCPHMVCSRCKTHWCYSCGKQKFMFVPLFGHHEDKFSVFGCTKSKLITKSKASTQKIRWAIFTVKLVIVILVGIPTLILIPVLILPVLFLSCTIFGAVMLNRILNRCKTSWDY